MREQETDREETNKRGIERNEGRDQRGRFREETEKETDGETDHTID